MTEEVEYDGPERRRCSDKLCREAREEWVKDSLWPKIRAQVAMMIGATVVFCASIFLYLNHNAIRDYELQAQSKYISAARHENDMARIENRIEKMEMAIKVSMDDVAARLDRNLAEIRAHR